MKKSGAILVLAVLMSAGAAQAASTLTFDELPLQSVDGLSYEGVTFGFTVGGSPSTDAYYGGDIGPDPITYLQGKSLEGTARGILTLDFASPTNLLEFGIAMNTITPATGAYTVELFDKSLGSIGIISENMYPLIHWSEDKFSYSGTLVSRAAISFNGQYATRRFAVDNLSTNTIPAPGAILLGSIGVSCVGWLRRRKTL